MPFPAIVCLNPSVDRRLLCPGFREGGHLPARRLEDRAGGKGVNVARALARMAGPPPAAMAALYGFVGRGQAAFFRGQLEGLRLANRLTPVPGDTRLCYTVLRGPVPAGRPRGRSSSFPETHLREPGHPLPDGTLGTLARRLAAPSMRRSGVLFCGSLPPGVTLDQWEGMLRGLVRQGVPVGVDAPGPALARAAEAGAVFIKPNREELSGMAASLGWPASQSVSARLRLLRRRFPALTVLATGGPDGAWLMAGLAPSPFRPSGLSGGAAALRGLASRARRVASTVGAGDAFLAGYLGALSRGLSAAACLARATAAAGRHLRSGT